MTESKIRQLSEIALLAAFIAISGTFKLPSFIPGSEFQLSAPIAVAVCKSRLFYLLSGPVASAAARLALGLIIGKAVYPLLAAALPGMAFTALTAGLLASVLEKALLLTNRNAQRS